MSNNSSNERGRSQYPSLWTPSSRHSPHSNSNNNYQAGSSRLRSSSTAPRARANGQRLGSEYGLPSPTASSAHSRRASVASHSTRTSGSAHGNEYSNSGAGSRNSYSSSHRAPPSLIRSTSQSVRGYGEPGYFQPGYGQSSSNRSFEARGRRPDQQSTTSSRPARASSAAPGSSVHGSVHGSARQGSRSSGLYSASTRRQSSHSERPRGGSIKPESSVSSSHNQHRSNSAYEDPHTPTTAPSEYLGSRAKYSTKTSQVRGSTVSRHTGSTYKGSYRKPTSSSSADCSCTHFSTCYNCAGKGYLETDEISNTVNVKMPGGTRVRVAERYEDRKSSRESRRGALSWLGFGGSK